MRKISPLEENFKRISLVGSETTTTTRLFFFRSLQHLTRARVFHGLEYCFFASFPLLLLLTLSLLYVFPHIKHFPTRALSIGPCARAAQRYAFGLFRRAVSHSVVGVLRNCFSSIAIVLQLQSHDGKRQSEQNG
jgi:hypothetical protein